MATNAIITAVCKAINFDADMIDRLAEKYETNVTDEQMNDALDYCKSKGDLSDLSTMLVRYIFLNLIDRYKEDLDEDMFTWSPMGSSPSIRYAGKEIVSNMHLCSIVREKKENEQREAQKNAHREFHLTDSDKKILLSWGYLNEDMDQIELEANVCEYTQCYKSKFDRKITRDEAIKLLGRTEFLSGVSRTAFHWNCGRERGNRYVHFESGIVGRHVNPIFY